MFFLSDASHIQPPRSATARLEEDLIGVQRLSWIVAWLVAAGGVLAVWLAATKGLANGILILTVAAMIPPAAWLIVRRLNGQILSLARSLGPRLRDSGMTSTRGALFVFDNGLVFQIRPTQYPPVYAFFHLFMGPGGSILTPIVDDLKGPWLARMPDPFLDRTHVDPRLQAQMKAIASDFGGSLKLMGVHEVKTAERGPPVLLMRQAYARLSFWSWLKRGAEIGLRVDEVAGVLRTLGA